MKTLKSEMIKKIETDIDNQFAWAVDAKGNNLLLVQLNDKGLIDLDNCGYDWGTCGDYNSYLGYDDLDNVLKTFLIECAQYGLLDIDGTSNEILKSKYAIIQHGYSVLGWGDSVRDTVAMTNEFIDNKIYIKDNDLYFECDNTLLSDNEDDDGHLFITTDKEIMFSYVR